MQKDELPDHLYPTEKAVTGPIVDSGPDHITVRDVTEAEDITVRTDDTTHYTWIHEEHRGRLTDTARIRVGYYLAGGVHKAHEIIVLDPGDGVDIAQRIVTTVH